MEKKKETYTFTGLGFPVQIINCPMKKILEEWVIDINLNALQLWVFNELIHKQSPLTGKEMKFMRKFMHLTTESFGKRVGVSHAAVVKWEKEQAKLSPVQEIYIRMVFLELLKNMEINAIFKDITPETLSRAKEKNLPLVINPEVLADAI